MFLATVNKPRQLLFLSYIGDVRAAELAQCHDEVIALMNELQPGFRLLSDLSKLESMEVECGSELGKIMEHCDRAGVELIVRIIPKPDKDIGLAILSIFHYPRRPRVVTCESMVDAGRLLMV